MTDIFDRHPEFRGKPVEMAMMCTALRDRGQHDDALAMGKAAVAAAPDSTSIRTNVGATLSTGVAAFHVPMLLDHPRNAAYRRAIERLVRPGMKVLEIGSGAGLLAMMCARAGAEVVTCEEHPMIAAAAARIIETNGLSDRITLIRKHSTDMIVPDDLPEPADLVIHEIFGSTLFDEGVDVALTDARKRLLKPDALSIPPRAHVRFRLVRDPKEEPPGRLDDVEGFDLSGFELLGRPTTPLGKARIRRLEPVTAPSSALFMDYDRQAGFGAASQTIELRSLGGRVDAIAQWIALDFGDGEMLENDPFTDAPDSSWGIPYTSLVAPIETRPGDPLFVTFRRLGNLLLADVATRPPC